MFGVSSGDSLLLLADKSRGIALQRVECLNEIVHQIVENAGDRNGSSES